MSVHTLQHWGAEAFSLAGSLIILGAMIGLLAEFNDQPVFGWNGVTLNTIISLQSVIMKGLLLFSAAECIGQWKWILLYRNKMNLIDFERIDQASRGPLGCINLIARRATP